MNAREENAGAVPSELSRCREEIGRIDAEIVALLSRRVEVALRTGKVKREHGLPILDPRREAEVIRGAAMNARAAGLAEESVRGIFWLILGLSRKAEQPERE